MKNNPDKEETLLLDEADYPESWNTQEFKAINSFAGRVRYAKEHLGKVASGSARVVFEINPSTVLKVARNKKGLAQNELEAEISASDWYSFVAKVYDSDPQNLWIEMEKALKLTKSKFKQLTGHKFDDFVELLRVEALKSHGDKVGFPPSVHPDAAEAIFEDELFNELLSYANDYDVPPGDLTRISSWGMVNRDGEDVPVLVDYGLNRSIYNDYYLPKPKEYGYGRY